MKFFKFIFLISAFFIFPACEDLSFTNADIFSPETKAVKEKEILNTESQTENKNLSDKALISFDEIIVNGEESAIETFPVFINGDLRETLFKDIALNFFESLPSVLGLALRTKIPQTGIHFINTDLKNKIGKFSVLEAEKKQSLQYLELKNIKLLKLVIK